MKKASRMTPNHTPSTLRPVHLFSILTLASVLLQTANAAPINVPREKIHLSCTDDYFKTARTDFLLDDEHYSKCVLTLPLALKERWKGSRRFYIIPRLSADVSGIQPDNASKRTRVPLSGFMNPGNDALHRVVFSENYQAVELFSSIPTALKTSLGEPYQAASYNINGKITVCVGPVYQGEEPCVTFNVIARFKVYHK